MQLYVEHSTVYRYDDAVYLEPHTFRLRPRMSASQQLLQFDLQIAPEPAGTAECMDQDGNLALQAWFSTPTRELNVRSRFRVDLPRENAFDYILPGNISLLSLWYEEPLSTALAPYRNYSEVGGDVRAYARTAARRAGFDLAQFLSDVNWDIFHSFRQIHRAEGSAWPSDLTLRVREGSCRDLAMLFCDLCRVMGIAARFVSGYECATAGRADASMHAWAEVYLPGVGWRGYDPSRGLAVANCHVAVAAGFDPELAAPISGLYSGGSGSQMETYLRMELEKVSC
jgi:transglutaminase-like putative cysteine protease